MFVITFEDGSTIVEGVEVNNWDEVPTDKKIAQVILSDSGRGIFESLSGFDYYVIAYEGSKRISVSVDVEGKPSVSNVGEAKVKAQHAYGIRVPSEFKRTVRKIASGLKAEAEAAFAPGVNLKNGIIIKARSQYMKNIDDRMEKLIEEVRAKEVVCLTLGVTRRAMKREEMDNLQNKWREGISDGCYNIEKDKIRKMLIE